MTRGRPRGVTYLVIYYLIVAVGILAITVWAIYIWRVIPEALAGFSTNPEILVGIALAVAAVHVTAAWGLWTLRWWSRLFAIGLSLAGIAFGLFTLPLGFASILLNLATFWYVMDHRVRIAFADAARRNALR